jgi:release factor glutamine methyltransferase
MNEAELVFTDVLKCNRASLYLDRHKRLSPETGRILSGILRRRAAGESLYHILGRVEFMGFEFRVTPACLVPRPETELLVEAAVSYAAAAGVSNPSILDIGTGSGCIAISIARLLGQVTITATDISPAALELACENARTHGVEDKIDFICSDVFPPRGSGPFDCIVSNPPYIRSADIEGLSAEVRCDPRVALDGGADGMRFYRQIIAGAQGYLSNHGLLIMEAGFDQAECVQQLIADTKKYTVKKVIRDYNDIQRVIIATKD